MAEIATNLCVNADEFVSNGEYLRLGAFQEDTPYHCTEDNSVGVSSLDITVGQR